MTGRPSAEADVLIRVAAAALLGGLIAVGVLKVQRDITHLGPLMGLVVVAVFCSLLAAGPFLSSAPSPSTRRPSPPPPAPSPPPPAASFAWSDPVPSAAAGPGPRADPRARPSSYPPADSPAVPPRWRPPPPEPAAPEVNDDGAPVTVAVPVHGGQWWESAGSAATRARAEDGSAVVTEADLADAGVSVQVMQCPRCGDFAVDVRQERPGFRFSCAPCGHRWHWEPGTPWPTGVVRPGRGHRPAPGSIPPG